MALLPALFIPFFVLAAAFVIIGIAQTHSAAHGTQNAPSFWDVITGQALIKELFGLAAKAGSYIASHFAQSQLRLLAKWLLAMGTLTAGWFGVNAAFSEAVATELEHLRHSGDPKARAKAAGAAAAAAAAKKAAHHAEQVAGGASGDLHKYKTKNDTRVQHNTHAVDVAIPRTIGGIRTKEGELTRDLGKLKDRTRALEDGAVKTWEWIRAHEKSVATGAFALAVGVALSRLGLGNLRCKNFSNLLKKFGCGLGTLLNDLLGLVVAGIILEGVCEFLPLVEAAFGAIAGPMVHILNDVPLGACETRPKDWATLSVAAGPLPPPQTLGSFPI